MSEQLQPQIENRERQESAPEAERQPILDNVEEKSPEERKEQLESLKQTVEHEAVSGKEIPVGKEDEKPQQAYVNKELRQSAFNRLLTHTQKKLSAPSRVFSKVTHQPTVDTISRVGEKTIARPSGLLMGGVCALIGSSTLLYLAKRNGFHYNLATFFVLFAAGFILGLVLEVLLRLFQKVRGIKTQ